MKHIFKPFFFDGAMIRLEAVAEARVQGGDMATPFKINK